MKRAQGAAILAALVFAGCGGDDLGSAPDVRGLALPEAKRMLKRADFGTSVSDDAMFGVIIESHFTVCDQHSPEGRLVPLEVSKEC